MKIDKELIKKITSVDLMEEMNISDTIVCFTKHNDDCNKDTVFMNIHTGKTSSDFYSCLRENKKYIYIEVERHKKKILGYLSKYLSEYDVLLTVFYELKASDDSFSWKESYRLIIGKDYYEAFTKKGTIMDKRNVDINFRTIPICGQFIHPIDMSSTETLDIINLPKDSAEETRKFCKGVFWTCYQHFTFHQYCCLINIIEEIDDCFITKTSFGLRKEYMKGVRVNTFKMPEHIIDGFSKAAGTCFNYCINNAPDKLLYIFDGIEGSILQNCGGEYVLRTFVFYPCGNIDEKGRMPIDFIEIQRVHITDECLNTMKLIYSPLLYYDRKGIENGPFKYVEKHLEWAEREGYLVKNVGGFLGFDTSETGTLCFPYIMAFYPNFEKLYNMIYSNSTKEEMNGNAKELLRQLRVSANGCNTRARSSLGWLIGEINENEKELHKIFGISKDMLKLISRAELSFDDADVIKTVFYNHTEYIELMNEKNTFLLLNFINEARKCSDDEECHISCLLTLMEMFGPKNIAGYIRFLSREYMDENKISEYSFYIEKLSVIKDGMKDMFYDEGIKNVSISFEWKIKYKDLEKADNAIEATYILINDKINYQDKMRNFERLRKLWERYEYHNNTFSIICPKSPSELVVEGFRLKHCAKNFITNVANGLTTIMFIRKTEQLCKPFYTLEIKDGIIRQCHGFGNCNASEYEGLMDFIRTYAKDKNIDISKDIDSRLAAD